MNTILLALYLLIPHQYEVAYEDTSANVATEHIEFQDYLPLKPLAGLLKLNYILDNTTQRLLLSSGTQKLVLIGNINTLVTNGVTKNIAFGPLYINGDVYFPVNEIITVLGGTFDKLIFVKEVKEVPLIDEISLTTRGDSTVLKLSWQKDMDFDVQFFVKKMIIEIDGQYKEKSALKPVGAVTAVKLSRFNTYTRMDFDVEGINAYLERDKEVVLYYKKSKEVKLIVLDPGHGGVDPGAVGKKGLYEKDANLGIARFLYEYLTDSFDIKVIMTRDKDKYLSLKERTNIANRNSADLFVSIHCNASAKTAKMTGFETYFLSEARTTEARAVAMRENASLRFDGIEPADIVSNILLDLAQTAYLAESNQFAECIQDHAEKNLPIPSRGVKQAGFYVLRGAFMPAVLVECAFVSNLEEEKLLKQTSFRKKLAYVIFSGIKNYIEDYERRLNN